MELISEKTQRGYEQYTVTLTAFFTPEEQQAISRANLWQTTALSFPAEFGLFRISKYYYPKYFEFLSPGIQIDYFTDYFANRFITRSEDLIGKRLRKQLGDIIRAHQIQQRDNFFNGRLIDITPGSPPTSLIPFPPAPRGVPLIGKPSLDIPTRNFSRINLSDFLQDKVVPTPIAVPVVDELSWHFDDPQHEDDHEVRLYAVMSAGERADVKHYGLYDHSFGEVPLFDDERLENLRHAMEQELAATGDPTVRASLRIEHQQLLKLAQESKEQLTLMDFFAYPFTKTYENRYQATQGQRKLNTTMVAIKELLKNHHGK